MTVPRSAERMETAGRSVRDAADPAADRGIDRVQPLLDHEIVQVAGLSITVGGVLASLFVIAAAWGLSRLLQRLLTRYGESHSHVNRASLYLLSRVLHYLVILVAVLLALDVAGVPIARFAVFAGAIGVGLGFGLQAIFNNFISGLILLFDRSLKVGDFVELASGVHGEVRDIKIRATTIVTNDNIDILVPNSEFVSGRVVNWTHREVSRRLRVPFGVAYGTDKEVVKKAALEAAAEVPFTLALDGPRRPQVWLVAWRGERTEQARAVPHVSAPAADAHLDHHERAELSRNDAERDVQQQIATDAKRAQSTENNPPGARDATGDKET